MAIDHLLPITTRQELRTWLEQNLSLIHISSVGGFVQNLVKDTLPLHELGKSVGLEPVSYTHLDVYKRQRPNNARPL